MRIENTGHLILANGLYYILFLFCSIIFIKLRISESLLIGGLLFGHLLLTVILLGIFSMEDENEEN